MKINYHQRIFKYNMIFEEKISADRILVTGPICN